MYSDNILEIWEFNHEQQGYLWDFEQGGTSAFFGIIAKLLRL